MCRSVKDRAQFTAYPFLDFASSDSSEQGVDIQRRFERGWLWHATHGALFTVKSSRRRITPQVGRTASAKTNRSGCELEGVGFRRRAGPA